MDDVYGWLEPKSFDITTLHPESKAAKAPLTNLPQTIEKKYLAALKVQDIEPSACAVLVGRTLEAMCNHEKATGKTLSDKVNNLVNSDRIPRTLAEMAHQLRQIRNFGAHDAEDEVTEEDVPIILDFLEAILEYLYVAPRENCRSSGKAHEDFLTAAISRFRFAHELFSATSFQTDQ